MTIQQITKDMRAAMDKGIESTRREFASIRSGKASPNMLDTVRVDMYGTSMALNQVASVSAPEPRVLIVTPFDKSQAKVIEKAIRESDLGLNPSSQGDLLRVPMPALSEERRKDLTKVVRHAGEEARIAVRNVRRDANEHAKKLLKDKEISEDDERRSLDELQRLTDRSIAEIDRLTSAKEAEILAV